VRKLKAVWLETAVNIQKIKFEIENANLNQNFKFEKSLKFEFENSLNFKFKKLLNFKFENLLNFKFDEF
jgi:hypothetical protein